MKRYAAVFAIVVLALLGAALILTRQPHIPSAISDEEYAVYSEWARSYFGKNPPQGQFYVLSRTFKFNPKEEPGDYCRQPMVGKNRVPASLTGQLAALGDAEYVFKDRPPASLRLPWKYALVDVAPDLAPGTFHLLAFSRIAFSWDHKRAFFAFSDACAAGECGRGGAVYASKKQGQWAFQSTGCFWLY